MPNGGVRRPSADMSSSGSRAIPWHGPSSVIMIVAASSDTGTLATTSARSRPMPTNANVPVGASQTPSNGRLSPIPISTSRSSAAFGSGWTRAQTAARRCSWHIRSDRCRAVSGPSSIGSSGELIGPSTTAPSSPTRQKLASSQLTTNVPGGSKARRERRCPARRGADPSGSRAPRPRRETGPRSACPRGPESRHTGLLRSGPEDEGPKLVGCEPLRQTRLTPDVSLNLRAPPWSPDGRQILMRGQGGLGEVELYLIDAAGTNLRKLTNKHKTISAGEWSPYGRRIAYTDQSASDAEGRLYVMNADGTGVRPLKDDTHGHFYGVRSPDGGEIAYKTMTQAQRRGTWRWWTSLPGYRIAWRLGPFPRWSPDGRWIAYADNQGRKPHPRAKSRADASACSSLIRLDGERRV
jgi:hypothetical protein